MNKIQTLVLLKLISEAIVDGDKLAALHHLQALTEELFTEDEKAAKKE